MADIYRMPTAQPPSDETLDELDRQVSNRIVSLDVDPLTRKLLRAQRDTIRNLRVAFVREQTHREAVEAIAKMRRDIQTVEEAPDERTDVP